MILFVTFISIFMLGFQQQNVTHGHYWMAAGTSFMIALSQFALYKMAVAGDIYDALLMGVGGAAGITASMASHRRIRKWMEVRE